MNLRRTNIQRIMEKIMPFGILKTILIIEYIVIIINQPFKDS